MAAAGGGSGLRCGSLPGGDVEGPGRGGSPARPCEAAFLNPRRRLPRPDPAGAWDGVEPGRAGLGASPPGAAPSDRLPPPPPPPQTLGVSASLREGGRWPRVLARQSSTPTPGMSRPAPLTLRPRLPPRLRLRHRSHKPGSRGGGRRHPRVIGRSNRGPRAGPRVQSSNEAEEELPPKAGKIGHRIIHLASPAYFLKTLYPTAPKPAVRVSRTAAESGDGVERRGGKGVREI